jgi:hypothetical protein
MAGILHGTCPRGLRGADGTSRSAFSRTQRAGVPARSGPGLVRGRLAADQGRTGGRAGRVLWFHRVHQRRLSPLRAARPTPGGSGQNRREVTASAAGTCAGPVVPPGRSATWKARPGGSGRVLGQLVRPSTGPAVGADNAAQRRRSHRTVQRPAGLRLRAAMPGPRSTIDDLGHRRIPASPGRINRA